MTPSTTRIMSCNNRPRAPLTIYSQTCWWIFKKQNKTLLLQTNLGPNQQRTFNNHEKSTEYSKPTPAASVYYSGRVKPPPPGKWKIQQKKKTEKNREFQAPLPIPNLLLMVPDLAQPRGASLISLPGSLPASSSRRCRRDAMCSLSLSLSYLPRLPAVPLVLMGDPVVQARGEGLHGEGDAPVQQGAVQRLVHHREVRRPGRDHCDTRMYLH